MSEMLKVATFSELQDRKPAYALAGEVDLAVSYTHLTLPTIYSV